MNSTGLREPIPGHIIRQALDRAFVEDWGLSGDITSRACISPDVQVQAQLRLRGSEGLNDYVPAGLELAKAAFHYDDAKETEQGRSALRVELRQSDGAVVSPGSVLAEISGPARLLLGRERVALNYLCHLSGIASVTRQYVRAVAHTSARIVDTRKTTPGLRALEKFAVRCGGGGNHRFGLFDAMMIKDNHIAAAGGIVPALRAARANGGHMVSVELEVDTLEQLYQVNFDDNTLRPDCVLLDNMSLGDMKRAVAYVAKRAFCEASGGIRLERVPDIAETGVDLISVGALTHSAPIVDIGLDINLSHS
ncbi:carboxylating nicotinate-nucleotide diphosphorylase [Candidatus Haliotispira prima]|uniref:nicotinate-nucleotide diphosphorylase (carboxylating) n=1 Tax=Candidatus Haliotispira prima TaxID=3034016 RepID=A0ABY8MJC1_9SPIO|nr:carboxylating nicotinate-nucleotide diphosphorylase [Candidatus Haliotispira prima]